MRVEVNEDALLVGATTVARAAALVASLDVRDVSSSVALAMPGSLSVGLADRVVALLSGLAADLARDLSGHADALRLAGVEYAETDRHVAAVKRQ